MGTVILSSQMNLYYNMRNVFLAVFAVLSVTGIIYGLRIHIVLIIQKHFGIEKRREIARMQEGEGHGRKTSERLKAVHQNGKKAASGAMAASREIDVSRVNTMKLQQAQERKTAEERLGTVALRDGRDEPGTMVLREETWGSCPGEEPGTMVLREEAWGSCPGEEPGTMVLREEAWGSCPGEEPGTMAREEMAGRTSQEEMPGTMVLGRMEGTMVLNSQETVVLDQEQSGEIRKRRNVVLVHGEDIF